MSIARAIKSQRNIARMAGTQKDGRRSVRVPDPKTVGGRVQILRESRDWSQARLAKEAGIAQPTLANFERGQTLGGLALTIGKLAAALGVDAEWLRTGAGDPARHLDSSTAAEEALAIYRALSESDRVGWMAAGRAMISSRKKP